MVLPAAVAASLCTWKCVGELLMSGDRKFSKRLDCGLVYGAIL